MASFTNDLRLKEITTGDEDGQWGTSTNTNLSLIADAFSLGTKQMAADAGESFTMPDAVADGTRSLFLKITSAVSLTATRTVTLLPNTVSKVWIIENATTGSQIITIAQGSGATVNVPSGSKVMVVTDGAGAGAAVFNANPTVTAGTVDLTSDVTGTLPVANGGTGITSFGTNVAAFLGTPSSANLAAAVTDETGTGALVFASSPVLGGIITTASGNLRVYPATQILEVLGDGSSVVGQIQLNCHVNSHGQRIASQPHSQAAYNVLTLPGGTAIGDANATLVSDTGTQTLTNKTINLASNTLVATSAQMAAAVTDETGSGALVFATSPTLVTPALGTPASGNISNTTVDGTNAPGFRTIPQNSQSAAYTLVLTDSGKHILHPSADTTARIFTIPANASVAFPVGAAVSFVNQVSGGAITIAITTDTMRLAGAGTTGSRTLAANGVATAIKLTATEWIISGTGLT